MTDEEKAEERYCKTCKKKNNCFHTINESEEIIAELKAQIEGMKNVGNCNKAMKCSKWVEQHIQGNKVTCCCGCVEWEKAE